MISDRSERFAEANSFLSLASSTNSQLLSGCVLTLGNARNLPHARRLWLAHYCTLTSRALDFAIGVIGRCTFSTPSRKSAVTFEPLASSGSVKLRRKLPKDRSMRWNFLF